MWGNARLPSVQTGYARSPAESAYPQLWDRLILAQPFGMMGSGSSRFANFVSGPPTAVGSGQLEWVGGEHGRNLKFDELNPSYLDYGANALDIGLDDFTVCVRYTQAVIDNTFNTIVDKYTGTNGYRILNYSTGNTLLDFTADSTLHRISYNSTSIGGYFGASILWSLRRTGDAELYVNGDLKNSTDISGSVSVNSTNAENLFVSSTSSTTMLQGSLDELFVWRRPLTSEEARTINENPYAPFHKRRRIYALGQAVGGSGSVSSSGIIIRRRYSKKRKRITIG